MRPGALAALLVSATTAACTSAQIDPMEIQPRVDPYEGSRAFPDGQGMRRPPAGAVPIEQLLRLAEAARPPTLTLELLETGRSRWNVYCAACHGVLADGDSPVARRMALRRPPDLRRPQRPPGRVFQVVTEGYGLMPSYAHELPPRERWAVVAYLQALLSARAFPTEALSPDERRRLGEASDGAPSEASTGSRP